MLTSENYTITIICLKLSKNWRILSRLRLGKHSPMLTSPSANNLLNSIDVLRRQVLLKFLPGIVKGNVSSIYHRCAIKNCDKVFKLPQVL